MTTTGSLLVLSGPNLALLGTREPHIYGTETLDDHLVAVAARAERYGFTVRHRQSDHEGELIEEVGAARGRDVAIIVNPAACTHYAWGLHDALAAFDGPVIEVHLSNPSGREAWRHRSVVAPVATATIAGLGGFGYELAVDAVAHLLARSAP